MELQSLHLNRELYGPRKGHYGGKVTFVGTYGEISLVLDNDLSVKILGIVGDCLVESSKSVANLLTKDVIQAQESIPAPAIGKIITDAEEM